MIDGVSFLTHPCLALVVAYHALEIFLTFHNSFDWEKVNRSGTLCRRGSTGWKRLPFSDAMGAFGPSPKENQPPESENLPRQNMNVCMCRGR